VAGMKTQYNRKQSNAKKQKNSVAILLFN